jgi:hypothetical protein
LYEDCMSLSLKRKKKNPTSSTSDLITLSEVRAEEVMSVMVVLQETRITEKFMTPYFLV